MQSLKAQRPQRTPAEDAETTNHLNVWPSHLW
jgi:hypothetical protein